MGKEARYKKEVKIYGTLKLEELFLCCVHPSLFLLIFTYRTSWAAPLGKKFTGKCIHACHYSARAESDDILCSLAHNKTFAFFTALTQHTGVQPWH